jgi:uncharacterized protein YwqG
MENRINFVNPKLSNLSTNKNVLDAIKEFEEVSKSIKSLEDKNRENYADFINNHRSIIKKNIPIVGKAYRVIDKSCLNGYPFSGYVDNIEYMYVITARLSSKVDWCRFMPKINCYPLDKDGKPLKDKGTSSHFWFDDYERGQEIEICCLSSEDYPNIAKSFKKIKSKKTEDELAKYQRLKRKYGDI